jgi:regulator of sigma E protease
VHEAGHFAVAKAFGMRVLAFSLGFGRRVFGFTRGETEYRIGILPLGGYVKLSGEDASRRAATTRATSSTARAGSGSRSISLARR